MDNDTQSDGCYLHLYVLLRTNHSLRLYLLSALITQFGEWFTYVASITMIQTKHQDDAEHRLGNAE